MARPHGRRQATFSERRAELFSDVAELGVLCGADVAVIVFDPSGRVYALGTPDSADGVLRRRLPVPVDHEKDAPPVVDEQDTGKEEVETRAREEEARIDALKEKLQPAMAGKRWWEADVSAISDADLPEFVWALQRLRNMVLAQFPALIPQDMPSRGK